MKTILAPIDFSDATLPVLEAGLPGIGGGEGMIPEPAPNFFVMTNIQEVNHD
jgi:hypothetical protein